MSRRLWLQAQGRLLDCTDSASVSHNGLETSKVAQQSQTVSWIKKEKKCCHCFDWEAVDPKRLSVLRYFKAQQFLAGWNLTRPIIVLKAQRGGAMYMQYKMHRFAFCCVYSTVCLLPLPAIFIVNSSCSRSSAFLKKAVICQIILYCGNC